MEMTLEIINEKNIWVFMLRDNSRDKDRRKATPGNFIFRTKIPGNLMNVGTYKINLGFVETNNAVHVREHNVVSFQVKESIEPNSARGLWNGPWDHTAVRPKIDWTYESIL